MNWTQFLISEVVTTYATTAKLLDKVDENSLGWKPADGCNWMTTGQLLKHIANACGSGCKGLVTGNWGLPGGKKYEDLSAAEIMPPAAMLPTVQSVEEARRLLAEDEAVALQMINEAGESDLGDREVFAPWAPGVRLALGSQIFQMVKHLGYHKSQLFYYLKLQGKPVNTVDLWG